MLLVRKLERRLGLPDAIARALADPRDPEKIEHTLAELLRQRVFAPGQGYEDLNDHAALRMDRLMQSARERDTALASAPTLYRLENRATRAAAWAIHGVILEKFIAGFQRAPEELVLDFDATDYPLYGRQEGRFFHGCYDSYFAANQFRLLLSSLAYILTSACRLRARTASGTDATRKTLEDRHGNAAQHPPRARAVELGIPLSGDLSRRRPSRRTRSSRSSCRVSRSHGQESQTAYRTCSLDLK